MATGALGSITAQYGLSDAEKERYSPSAMGDPLGVGGIVSGVKSFVSDPVGTIKGAPDAISSYLDKPTNQLGIIGGLAGVPMAGRALDAVARQNMALQEYDRAQADRGTPGFSYGMIDGQPYSVGYGALGDRVVTGTVPDWFTVDIADHFGSYTKGFDTEGKALSGGDRKFTYDGFLMGPFGYDVPSYEDVEDLAKNTGINTETALATVNSVQAGNYLDVYGNPVDLQTALDTERDREVSKGLDIGFDVGVDAGVSVADVEGVAGVDYDSDETDMSTDADDAAAGYEDVDIGDDIGDEVGDD
jgi:hypothetical protein